MANIIQVVGFSIDGNDNPPSCNIDPNHDVELMALVNLAFAPGFVGDNFKCEWKVHFINHNIDFLFYSPLQFINSSGTYGFYSPKFTRPIEPETYKITWVTVYNSDGNTVADGCPGCV